MKFAKRVFAALVAINLVFGGASLIAVSGAQAQDFSESHLAAAQRAIDASRSTNALDNILPRLSAEIKNELIRNRPDAEAQINLIVDESALEVAGRRGDLEREATTIFARVFTEEELTTIAEFYESEAGKKFLQESPIVLREIQRASQVWTGGIRRDMGEIVQKKMGEAGLR